jgi:SAM-dependent methyltransferase
MSSYDKVILDHYQDVAKSSGLSSESTMMDSRTRELETKLLSQVYLAAIKRFEKAGRKAESLVVADFGCGNGYTLEVLSKLDNRPKLVGYEFSPDLRALAKQRFGGGRVDIRPVDIRKRETMGPEPVDIAISQRVVINLLSNEDQVAARDNLVQATSATGILVFIECFHTGLDNLNAARSEFGLKPLPPAHHNLYLADDFFANSGLVDCVDLLPENPKSFLSTHYYVTRVLHELALDGRPFVRNSHFVKFMSQALQQNIGEFSPIRAAVFRKSERA